MKWAGAAGVCPVQNRRERDGATEQTKEYGEYQRREALHITAGEWPRTPGHEGRGRARATQKPPDSTTHSLQALVALLVVDASRRQAVQCLTGNFTTEEHRAFGVGSLPFGTTSQDLSLNERRSLLLALSSAARKLSSKEVGGGGASRLWHKAGC